ncbi:MAG: alginate lyase family protein [Actinomycetota bacterium]|nr:alginate lyase family protein [Actinomycetota bacterium]
MKKIADSTPGTANLGNQNNFHAPRLLAKALVWKRTGQASYRRQVEDGIRAAIGTEENRSPDQQLLAMSRQIACYVICADLIGMDGRLRSTAPGRTSYTWSSWLSTIRTKNVGTHGAWKSLTQCHEDTDNNWGTFSGSSRIAVALYLGDTADVARASTVHRRWLGDRSQYMLFPRCSSTSDSWDPSYVSLEPKYGTVAQQTPSIKYNNRVSINPPDCVGGDAYNGIIVMDMARSAGAYDGHYGGFDSTGTQYAWGVLQGTYLSSLLLERGGYPDAFSWSSQALRRAVAWLDRAGDVPHQGSSNGRFVLHLADSRYDTSYGTVPAEYGRCFGYTDWLFPRP